MPANLPPSEWEALSRALQHTIDEWRQAHPTATLDEIESIIDTHLAPLRAKVVEATAQASWRRDWQPLETAKQPLCTTCGAPLVARGQHRRRLQTTGGASIELERTSGVCPIGGQGRFPRRTRELGLTSASLTPHALEGRVRLSTWLPFRRAAEIRAALTGVQVSEAPARRWTETSGAAAYAVQSERAEAIRCEVPPAPLEADRLLLSADGAFVPLLHGEWAEAKLLVIGAVTTDPAGQPQTTALSYFAQVAEAEVFGQAALVETHRRGLERAEAVCAVTDGDEWVQGLVDDHRADALRILDFAHAASYVSQIGQAVQAAGTSLAPTWLDLPPPHAQARWAGWCPDRAAKAGKGTSRPGDGAGGAGLSRKAGRSDAISLLSGGRLAHRVGQRGEWAQSGHAGATHGTWDALGTHACQSLGDPTDNGVQRSLDRRMG